MVPGAWTLPVGGCIVLFAAVDAKIIFLSFACEHVGNKF